MSTLYYPFTENIGDDLQNIVLLCLFKRIDRVFSRDEISLSVSEINTKGIINGWLSRDVNLEFDPEKLASFCPAASFHIAKSAEKIHLSKIWLKYFSNSEFCLTRDIHTRQLLRQKNIEAEFGGCLTVLLNKFFKKIEQCDFNLHTEYDYFLENGDKKSIFFNPQCITWQVIFSLPTRIGLTILWLALISCAKKIYTKRLHTALPSFSLNNFDNKYFEFLPFNNIKLPTGPKSRLEGYENLLKLKELDYLNNNKFISTEDIVSSTEKTLEFIELWFGISKKEKEKEKKDLRFDLNKIFDTYSYFVKLIYNHEITEENLKSCFSLSTFTFQSNLKFKDSGVLNSLVWLDKIFKDPIINLPPKCNFNFKGHKNFYR